MRSTSGLAAVLAAGLLLASSAASGDAQSVRLAKSYFPDKQLDQPATLTVQHTDDGEWVTKVDAALVLELGGDGGDDASSGSSAWTGNLGVAAALGSARGESARFLTPFLAARTDRAGLLLAPSLLLETARGLDVQKLVGGLRLSPLTEPWIGIGVPLGKGDPVVFRWRPYVGIEGGPILETSPGDVEGAEGDGFARLTGDVQLRLWLMGGDAESDDRREIAVLAVDWRGWFLTEADRLHGFLSADLTFPLTKTFGVGFEYQLGRRPPLWGEAETFALRVGVSIE